jgi:hypothetical protein
MEHQEGAGEPRRRTRWWRTNPIQICRVRVQLRVYDHLIFKLTSKLHTITVLDVLHMNGKLRR